MLVLQVLYSYGIGFVYILLGLLVSGQITPAFKFCLQVRHNGQLTGGQSKQLYVEPVG